MTTLQECAKKVRDFLEDMLAHTMFDAVKSAFDVHLGKAYTSDLENDPRIKDCAARFYELGKGRSLLDTEMPDLGCADRLGEFAEILTELRECTRLSATYQTSCQRFVTLGWVPPADEAVRAAVIRFVRAVFARKDSPFGTLRINDVSVPEDLYEDADDDDDDAGEEGEGEEDEEGEEDGEEDEEVQADSAEEDDEEQEQYEDDQEEEEEEAVPDSAEEDDEEEEEEEPVPPPKKRKIKREASE